MKTFADLKRDLQVGKVLTMTYNALSKDSENIKSRLNKPRKIVKIQTNGVYLEVSNTGKGSYLEFPVATLVEYDGKLMSFYKCGKRALSREEKALLANEPSKRKENKQQAINDALTDGSSTYWMDKRYYKENNAEWRYDWSKGLRLDINDNTMWDKKIKGDLDLQYTIK